MTAYFHPLRRCKRHGLTFGRRTGSVLTSMVGLPGRKREGLDGKRSGLFYEATRLIRELSDERTEGDAGNQGI